MNRPTFVHSRPSAVAPMAGWGSSFPIVAGLRYGLELAHAISPTSRDGNVEPRVPNSQSNLPQSHPASSLPTLPGSHAAGLVPRAGRTFIRHGSAGSPLQWATANVSGGAVAHGFRCGMSGIRYLGSTLLELGRRGARKAMIGVCSTGGMAAAATSSGDPK